jgi:hypothetical protein
MHKPWVAPTPAVQQIKLDRRGDIGRNDSIHTNEAAESHKSAAQCMREVSVAAYQLVAKGCQALVAVYDTAMTLVELAIGACKLLLAVGASLLLPESGFALPGWAAGSRL